MQFTLFPLIRGPGRVPPATTTVRLNPSGAKTSLVICRSAMGPMEALARFAKASKERPIRPNSVILGTIS